MLAVVVIDTRVAPVYRTGLVVPLSVVEVVVLGCNRFAVAVVVVEDDPREYDRRGSTRVSAVAVAAAAARTLFLREPDDSRDFSGVVVDDALPALWVAVVPVPRVAAGPDYYLVAEHEAMVEEACRKSTSVWAVVVVGSFLDWTLPQYRDDGSSVGTVVSVGLPVEVEEALVTLTRTIPTASWYCRRDSGPYCFLPPWAVVGARGAKYCRGGRSWDRPKKPPALTGLFLTIVAALGPIPKLPGRITWTKRLLVPQLPLAVAVAGAVGLMRVC